MEADQFTARIDKRLMRVIRKLAKQNGVSINEQINQLLTLGFIAKAAKQRKKASACNTGPV